MNTGRYIASLRAERNLTQRKLAKAAGISNATLSKIENLLATPDLLTLEKLSHALRVSVSRLLDPDGPASGAVKIPVLGSVRAGIPSEAVENILDYEEIPAQMARGGDYFGLAIKGDSMEPRIKEGDVVIIRAQSDADSGKVAVVLVGDEDATIKRLIKSPEGLALQPDNPAYNTLRFSWKEAAELPVVILGQVVELRARFY